MRRAAFAILGTAAATSLLVGIKAQADPSEPPGKAAAQQEPAAGTGPAGSAPASVAQPAAGAASGTPAGQPPAQPAQPAQNANRTIEGDTIQTPYGDVTVTITVTGKKIVDIKAVMPTTGESAARTANAGPKLRQQALAKQSANIDTVSGATYTSEGYRESLQSALDQLG